MSKRRMISEDFFQSEGVIDWTMRQRLLVLGIIANADDQGRIRGHPKWLKSRIFPYDDFAPKDIEDDLQAVATSNDTILLYKAKGKRCIQLTNWWEYQSLQWAKPSDLPAPDDWTDRIRIMVYKPKRWVMTLNWFDVEDHATYKVMPLGNKQGSASPITNINTNTITNTITESVKGKKSKKSTKPPPLTADEILELVPLPDEFAYSLEFTSTWTNFIEHRIELGKPFKKRGAQMALNRLSKYKLDIAIASMQDSISNGWQGLFPDKVDTNNKKGGRRKSQAELRQEASDQNIKDIVQNIMEEE